MTKLVRHASKWNPAIWSGLSSMLCAVATGSDDKLVAGIAYVALVAFVTLATIVTVTGGSE